MIKLKDVYQGYEINNGTKVKLIKINSRKYQVAIESADNMWVDTPLVFGRVFYYRLWLDNFERLAGKAKIDKPDFSHVVITKLKDSFIKSGGSWMTATIEDTERVAIFGNKIFSGISSNVKTLLPLLGYDGKKYEYIIMMR